MVFWFCFVIFAIKVRDDDFFFYDKSFQPNSINEIFSIFLKTSDAQGIQHFIGQAQPYKFKIELHLPRCRPHHGSVRDYPFATFD
jgi:hypothetical protein